MSDAPKPAPIVTTRPYGVNVDGVVYSWSFFAAMSARLPVGTLVDVERNAAGKALLYTHRPRAIP